jgi:hypothetical protein
MIQSGSNRSHHGYSTDEWKTRGQEAYDESNLEPFGIGYATDISPREGLASTVGSSLPLPIIIPQRRPENKSRGWAIAYAPVLGQCGIDQDMFIQFILEFNEACKVSLAGFFGSCSHCSLRNRHLQL